jgi:hypothetical protein
MRLAALALPAIPAAVMGEACAVPQTAANIELKTAIKKAKGFIAILLRGNV